MDRKISAKLSAHVIARKVKIFPNMDNLSGFLKSIFSCISVNFIIMKLTFTDHTVLDLESGTIKVVKIGGDRDNNGNEGILGCYELGCINGNGNQLSDFCAFNDLVFSKSILSTDSFTKPNGSPGIRLTILLLQGNGGASLLDARVTREADVASDQHLLLDL